MGTGEGHMSRIASIFACVLLITICTHANTENKKSTAASTPVGSKVEIVVPKPDSLDVFKADLEALSDAIDRGDPPPVRPFGERSKAGEVVSWAVENIDFGPETWIEKLANEDPWRPWCLTGATWYGFTNNGNIRRIHIGIINGDLEAARNRDWGDIWSRDRQVEKEVVFGVAITWSF